MAYGSSQARGLIRVVATAYTRPTAMPDPNHVCKPTPHPKAMPDPQPTERGQGSYLKPHGS